MRALSISIVLLFLACSVVAEEVAPTKAQVEMVRRWLANTSEDKIHQLRGKTGNKYYLHKDGHREAVYDSDGNLVKDGINDGSYNYAHPTKESLKHFNEDILPWIVLGNSRTDPTSVEERLNAYSIALGVGLSKARGAKKLEVQTVDEAELGAVRFFLEVLKAGRVEEILKVLDDPSYKLAEPFKIGEGLTKGLIAVTEANLSALESAEKDKEK